MDGWPLDTTAPHLVRIDPGEDLLDSLRCYCAEQAIRDAIVIGGYGTLATWSLHWVTHGRIPSSNHFDTGSGGIEILAMSGLVVAGEPHVHIALATTAGAFGGHLEAGSQAYVICEAVLQPISDPHLKRERVPVAVPGMGSGTVSRLLRVG